MCETRLSIDELYPRYKDLVSNVCRQFKKKLPEEELDDLTQSAWEQIIIKYPKYSLEKSELSTWVTLVTKSKMYNMIRDRQAEKRVANTDSISLDSLTDRGKFL